MEGYFSVFDIGTYVSSLISDTYLWAGIAFSLFLSVIGVLFVMDFIRTMISRVRNDDGD